MKYILKPNKDQLNVIQKALEFYSRFLAGQWEIPHELQFNEYETQGKPEDFWEKRNSAEELMDSAKTTLMNRPSNQSYGIGNDELHENAKIAYDIYRPILEEFNKDSENWNVYSSPGLSYSKYGRIKISKDEN